MLEWEHLSGSSLRLLIVSILTLSQPIIQVIGLWQKRMVTIHNLLQSLNTTVSLPPPLCPDILMMIVLLYGMNHDKRSIWCPSLVRSQARQDMRIAFVISRDNGQSWSDLIYVANTFAANRGQVNMTLDPVTGDLIFSWYDGRNDTTTYENIQYFAGIMPAAQLTTLVNDIPLSNPTYQSPNANVPGSYAITQVSSNTPSPNGSSNGTTFGSTLKTSSNKNVKGRMSRHHLRKSQQRP